MQTYSYLSPDRAFSLVNMIDPIFSLVLSKEINHEIPSHVSCDAREVPLPLSKQYHISIDKITFVT